MSQPSSDKPSGGNQNQAGNGPLQRRLLATSVAATPQPAEPMPTLPAQPVPSVSYPPESQPDAPTLADHFQQSVDAVPYATLGMLDGTVVARLPCHEDLGVAVIGRGSAATIRIADPFVHRIHCEIRWDTHARVHVIKHGDGNNGTFVNMQRITQPTKLIDGTRVRVGKTELIYRRVWYPDS